MYNHINFHAVRTAFLIVLIFPCERIFAQNRQSIYLNTTINRFVKGYDSMNIKELDVDYQANLNSIVSPDSLEARRIFFSKFKKIAANIKSIRLNNADKLQLAHLRFQISFELKRVLLEKKYRNESPSENTLNGGLAFLKDAKEWYDLYVEKYTSKHITPRELLALGKQQVAFVQRQLKVLQNQLGYKRDGPGFYASVSSPKFVLTDENEVDSIYNNIQRTVLANLSTQFVDTDIKLVAIMPAPKSGPQTPPAYFDDGKFYYNFFHQRHNVNSMEYLYLHEGVPGHYYDAEEFNKRQQHLLEKKFTYAYNGCFEGWAAYCEYLGKDLGLYKDPYAEIARWQWDLVRSARVVIDVGIHYKGWSKERAIIYWKKTIPNQDDIAIREVNRCFNWPCQVLSYKVGELAILKLNHLAKKNEGDKFNIRQFHQLILSRLKLPLEVLEHSIIKEILHHKNA